MIGNPESIILAKAKAFDSAALGDIYDRYSPKIFRYAMRVLGDPDAAEDCVAETFSRLLTAFKNGGGPDTHLQAYLYRIAHNWITDRFRRQEKLDIELIDDPYGISSDHDRQESDPFLLQQVRAALMQLTSDQRQVIHLKFGEGLNNKEISQIMEKPIGAVKALQHRALGSLKRILIPEEIVW